MKTRNQYTMVAAIALLLAALACGPAATVIVTATPLPQEGGAVPTTLPSATDVPAATDTPAPDVTGSGGCTLNAGWVADVTVPDNTQFAPGTAFVKTWRVRNSGSCTWETGSQLVYVSGDPLGGPGAVSVPSVAPGSTTDVSVNFAAPATPGTYRSTWQMQGPEGTRYGSQIYVQIVVPAPVSPTNTPPPGQADLIITNLTTDSAPRQGTPFNVVITIRNQGSAGAATFYWAWRACSSAACPYIEAPDPISLAPGGEVTVQMAYTYDAWSTYTTDAIVDFRNQVAEGDGGGESNNGQQLVLAVQAAPPAEPTTLTLHRTAHSGDLSSGGQSGSVRAGIAPAGNGIRGFLDFDLSQLPGLGTQAEIFDAKLDLSDYSGDCFEFLGPLHVYRVDYGAQINAGDYDSAPQSTVLDAASSANIFNPIDVTARVQSLVENEGAGHFQLRLQLESDDAGAAYACMMEWSDATLTVTYRP